MNRLKKAIYVDKVIRSCKNIEQLQIAMGWAIRLDLVDAPLMIFEDNLKRIRDQSSDS